MKIALLGTRGVPANYGGFETCAEEIGKTIVKNGHDVSVYCRYGNEKGNPIEYKGIKLIYKSCFSTKSLGTLTHGFNCMFHAILQNYDVLLIFNAGNSPSAILARLFSNKPIAINVDGLEWRRRKWGIIGRIYYQLAEWLSTKASHRIISDSRIIQKYYMERWKTNSTFIAYGAHIEKYPNPKILKHYNLEPNEYFFVASRLEPENNADITIRAFKMLETNKKLAIAGGANWDSPFVRKIQEETAGDSRIKLLGPVYKPGHIEALHTDCFAYIHGNEVGGTNPALLKALGFGNCVIALKTTDSLFNAEVVADSALLYDRDPKILLAKMKQLLGDPALVISLRRKAEERIREAYTWDKIADEYECLLMRLFNQYYKKHPESD